MNRRPLNLLLVEDSEMDAELVLLELRRHGYDVTVERVDSRALLGAALEARQWDIVVCDHGLPSFSSFEALSMVRDVDTEIPFVILSGTIGEEAAVESLKAGARDVVLKTNLGRIGPVVDRELRAAERRRSHRRTEQALLDSEARKSAILDSALDAVISIDHEGRIVDFNPSAEAMFGYARDAVSGEPIESLIPPSLRMRYRHALARELSGARRAVAGTRIEILAMRADGSEFPLELSITRSELAGRPFFTGYLRDLTERKQAEQERASLEAQFRQAQKLEVAARLAAGVTHDFNKLLSVVVGFSELLLAQLADDDPARPHVEDIRQAGEQATLLTRQLLAFSRAQALEPQILDLGAIVAEAEPLLQHAIGQDVELTTGRDARGARVLADPSQIGQVIMNLVLNARDAIPRGGRISVRVRDVDVAEDRVDDGLVTTRRGRYAVLTVTDTGVGMDAETRSHIFEPFFTTKEPGNATGLGLSTVYGIVKQSGGFIDVESTPGRGTTFAVSLPLVDTPPPASPAPVAAQAPVGGSETVLVVDDDPALSRLVRLVLEPAGYVVLTADSPAEARAIYQRPATTIDLLLSDVAMPEGGGLDLGRDVKAHHPAIGLLFMSGYSEIDENQRRALNAKFIQKPFALDQLRDKVRHALDTR